MSASQRRKGAEGEREFLAWLRTQTGAAVHRALGQARDGGADAVLDDVVFEVKRRRAIAPLRWMEQVARAAGTEQVPVVAMREDGCREWFVLLRASDFVAWAPKTWWRTRSTDSTDGEAV